MTVLFSDIRNFTTLSEKMTPDENFAFINAYLERMGPVIRAHNGFIDKYIGDAIMALFETADDALRAGLAMLDALDGFNDERARGRPRADRHRHRHQHRLADAGHDRREAPHGRHGHLRRRQPRLADREPDQGLSRRPADLAVHLRAARRSQGLRRPPDRRRGGQGQDRGRSRSSRCSSTTRRPSAPPRAGPASCCNPASTRSPVTTPPRRGAVSSSAWRWCPAIRRRPTC